MLPEESANTGELGKYARKFEFHAALPAKGTLQPDLTRVLKSVDILHDMAGRVFRTKIVRCFHQVIGGNIDEEKYYLQAKGEP